MSFKSWFLSKSEVKEMSWSDILRIKTNSWQDVDGVDIFLMQLASDTYVSLMRIAKGKSFPYHMHPDVHETVHVTKGKLSVNGRAIIAEGQKEKFAAGYPHELTAVEDVESMVVLKRKYS